MDSLHLNLQHVDSGPPLKKFSGSAPGSVRETAESHAFLFQTIQGYQTGSTCTENVIGAIFSPTKGSLAGSSDLVDDFPGPGPHFPTQPAAALTTTPEVPKNAGHPMATDRNRPVMSSNSEKPFEPTPPADEGPRFPHEEKRQTKRIKRGEDECDEPGCGENEGVPMTSAAAALREVIITGIVSKITNT